MSGTRIVRLIWAAHDEPRCLHVVVNASDFGTSGQGSIPGWAPIVHYFLFFFQFYNAELLPTSSMN